MVDIGHVYYIKGTKQKETEYYTFYGSLNLYRIDSEYFGLTIILRCRAGIKQITAVQSGGGEGLLEDHTPTSVRIVFHTVNQLKLTFLHSRHVVCTVSSLLLSMLSKITQKKFTQRPKLEVNTRKTVVALNR